MDITSSAFENEGFIPAVHTCDDRNISPPLSISGVPEGARSLVLIVDDPDVPRHIREDGMWDHWLVFNIPPHTREIPEGQSPPGVEGLGTNGDSGYYGPCPPNGEHRYFFKIYALDTILDLPQKPDKLTLEKAMTGHVIGQAYLMGRYDRRR